MIYKYSVHTSQGTHCYSITKKNRVMLFRKSCARNKCIVLLNYYLLLMFDKLVCILASVLLTFLNLEGTLCTALLRDVNCALLPHSALIGPFSFVQYKVNQSRYRPGVPRGFQEVNVSRLRDIGPGSW
jgi:hypothetical protein